MADILNVRGRIFDIQRFSVHDGPGIRTIVFLKGCPLRCRWCCNPESQSYEFEELTLAGKTKTVGRDVSVGEVLETVKRDRIYYRRSGGGLTLSGGEALFQADFAATSTLSSISQTSIPFASRTAFASAIFVSNAFADSSCNNEVSNASAASIAALNFALFAPGNTFAYASNSVI